MGKITFLQANPGRKYVAHDLAFATAQKIEADLMIIGEPNKKVVGKAG